MNKKNDPIKQAEVAIAVLRGGNIPYIAKIHGISQTNCKRIVNIYCAKSDHSLYDKLRDYPFGDFTIPLYKLREHADHFINKSRCNNGKAKITEQSPIWDLPNVQTLALNALWQRDIKTVADLLRYDERKLLRLPKLGKLGLQQLKDTLKEYGFSIANKE